MDANDFLPQSAYDAADTYLANKPDDEDSLGAVDEAAPHIAAAALRAFAADLDGIRPATVAGDKMRGFDSGLARAAEMARAAADEIAPAASTDASGGAR